MGFSIAQLLGNRKVSMGDTVQPNLAQTGGTSVLMGWLSPLIPAQATTTMPVTSPFYGSTDPDAFINVNTWGVPPYPVAILNGGAPEIAMNNAPNPIGVR